MLKYKIIPACEGFKKLNMPKIEDKEFRNQLIGIHFDLLDEKEKYEKAVEKLRAVYIVPLQDRIDEVQKLARQYEGESDPEKRIRLRDQINSFTDVDEAQIAFQKALEKLNKEEVGVPTISKKKFREEYAKQDYNPEVVENLHPLLADKPAAKEETINPF